MNTKLSLLKKMKEDLERSLSFKSEDEKIEHDAQMLMYSFLSEVERFQEMNKINRKLLAKKINTSGSYLTQIFRGAKPLNFITIAKLQKALNIKFEVSAFSRSLDIERNKLHLDIKGVTHDNQKPVTLQFPYYHDIVAIGSAKSVVELFTGTETTLDIEFQPQRLN